MVQSATGTSLVVTTNTLSLSGTAAYCTATSVNINGSILVKM